MNERPPDPKRSGLEKVDAGETIGVALSGGVDSTVAAWLLKQSGYAVTAIYMNLDDDPVGLSRAHEAAELLRLELKVLDLRKDFDRLVVSPFVSTYVSGRTPNPCVTCNPAVKFGLLADLAIKTGAAFTATGHYASFSPTGRLLRPKDRSKDQTYFLCRLRADQLSRAVFPLADQAKDEVRRLAGEIGLSPRAESQDVCFLSGGDYRSFIRDRLGSGPFDPGDFIDKTGRVMGRHNGVINYTIGQRRGLGVPGPEPYYVLELRPETRRVVIGVKSETFSKEFGVTDISWAGGPPEKEFRSLVQIRSRSKPAPAVVVMKDDTSALVTFDHAQSAVTSGQAAAFYVEDELWGGGWIERG